VVGDHILVNYKDKGGVENARMLAYTNEDGPFTCAGLITANGGIAVNGVSVSCNVESLSATVTDTLTLTNSDATGSITIDSGGVHVVGQNQTVTHRTNVLDFAPDQVGTFCESTGELADVYGVGYVPTLERPTDAIVKVRHSTTFSNKILGVIVDDHTFMSHGDGLAVVVNDADYSIRYEVGQVLVPDISGLCRVATHEEKLLCAIDQIHLPRITAVFSGQPFVAVFIG
jgi:hypothetical protein